MPQGLTPVCSRFSPGKSKISRYAASPHPGGSDRRVDRQRSAAVGHRPGATRLSGACTYAYASQIKEVRHENSPHRRHFGCRACSTRCPGVHLKIHLLAARWRSCSRPPPRRPQLPRPILKVSAASCRVATLGSTEAVPRSAPMSFSRANVWASLVPSYTSHAIFPIPQQPARPPAQVIIRPSRS